MSEVHITPREEMLAAVQATHPELVPKVEKELTFMALKDDIDGKGSGLDKMYWIWKKRTGQCGNANEIHSWTAYALGLTSKKPDDWKKFVELRRAFARAGFPDIDSDFVSAGRDRVIDHIVDKYGRERVGNIGTWAMLSLKAATKRAVKVFDLAGSYHKGSKAFTTDNELLSREISASLKPYKRGAVMVAVDDDGVEHPIKTTRDAYNFCPDFKAYMDKNPEMMKNLDHIEGLLSQFGVHASGIIISDLPLSEIAPVRPAKTYKVDGVEHKSYATQMPNDDLETLGLIKFDVLGIMTLDVIEESLKLIKSNYNIDIDLNNLPLDDKKTFELFQTGRLTGIFQCESFGMQKTCKEIKVDRFEDIMAALALYRPGPMKSIPSYAARKNGIEAVDYFHPVIEKYVKPFLEKTYGLLVYQEQIMQICNALAGFSISDGYVVIKGVGKKKIDIIQKFGEQFVAGCVEKGVPEDVARRYWGYIDKDGNLHGFIIPFANYGFNASHACCYAYNSYVTAYLKANYPEEFMCAYLNVVTAAKKWPKAITMEREAKKMGMEISKRSVNECRMPWEILQHATAHESAILRPSVMCKGMSDAGGMEIVAKAPFKNTEDFARRTKNVVDHTTLFSLCENGFFPKKKVDEILKEFEIVRNDMKNLDRTGKVSFDMFG